LKSEFPDISLTLVGDGPQKKSLIELAKIKEIEDSTDFTGAVYDDEQLAKLFLKSQVYVLAGMGGLSINEAMCYSLPIICSICDGTEKHLVYEGKNGLYFESDNLSSLTETIRIMLADSNKCQKMGLESLKTIKQDINEHLVVAKYIECFSLLK
jgi:glycosyltransferase involved in cell wall biosynthesis